MTTVLSGTSEDLRSYHALKVLAVATKSGIRLKTKELSSKDEVCALSPLAKSIVLSISDNGNDHVVGGSSSNVMRALASLDPLSSLNGSSDVEKAQVDSWVSYGTSSIEVCIEALKASQSSLKDNDKDQKQIVASIAKDFQFAISVINCHVMYATFMVGNRVTTADIALCSALKEAASVQLWDPDINSEDGLKDEKTVNICRWYNTLLNQDFMAQALSGNASNINNNTDNHTLPGVRLNGNAPPVQNKLYKRSRIRIKEVLANDGANFLNQEISVAGWTKTVRNKGRILFIELNDGSTGSSLQCLCIRDETAGFDQAKKSGGTGSSLRITGKIVPSQGEQSLELQATHCELLGAVYGGDVMGNSVGGANYPMSKKEHSLEHMRQHAHLRPRAGVHAAAMRIRHAMAYATHKFFHDHGFLYIHTPIITCADCEGAGEQFGATTLLGADHLKPGVTLPIHAEKKEGEDSQATDESGEPAKISKKEQKRRAKKLAKAKPQEDSLKPVEVNIPGAVDYTTDFFGKRANLTVSGQLNVETHACALSDVYTFGPTFRAENSHTARHLAEFWMIEPEIAFATLEDDINLAEDYLKYCVEYALEMCKDDLEFFENSKFGEVGLRDRLRNVLENPFKVSSNTCLS